MLADVVGVLDAVALHGDGLVADVNVDVGDAVVRLGLVAGVAVGHPVGEDLVDDLLGVGVVAAEGLGDDEVAEGHFVVEEALNVGLEHLNRRGNALLFQHPINHGCVHNLDDAGIVSAFENDAHIFQLSLVWVVFVKVSNVLLFRGIEDWVQEGLFIFKVLGII
mgnify:CR=1 FL=1